MRGLEEVEGGSLWRRAVESWRDVREIVRWAMIESLTRDATLRRSMMGELMMGYWHVVRDK